MIGLDGGAVDRGKHSRRHLTFMVHLAKLQMDAGRGFVLEPPMQLTFEDLHALQALQRQHNVFSLSLECATEANSDHRIAKTILITNVESLISRLNKHAAKYVMHNERHNLQEQEVTFFQQQLFQGLRRHLQTNHFPVFGCPDHWQWQPGELRCLHFSPRQTLCTPEECKVFEVSRVSFTGKRISVQQFVVGGSRTLEDDWKASGPQAGHQPWTGHTSFAVRVEIILPSEWSNLASNMAKSAAHDMYTFQNDEANFQMEWATVALPSQKLLGERARSSQATDPDDS